MVSDNLASPAGKLARRPVFEARKLAPRPVFEKKQVLLQKIADLPERRGVHLGLFKPPETGKEGAVHFLESLKVTIRTS